MGDFQVLGAPTTTHMAPPPFGGNVQFRPDNGRVQDQRPRDGIDRDNRGRSPLDLGNPVETQVAPRSPAEVVELQRRLNFMEDPGRHTVDSPVAGSRAGEMATLLAAASANPQIVAFTNALYDGNIYMIPRSMQADADRLAYANFARYTARYSGSGVTPNNAVDWGTGDFTRTVVYDTENEHNTWRVHAMVGDAKTRGDFYLPRGIAARHELMHVEETRPFESSREAQDNPVGELMPTMMTIIEADAMRKQLQGQSLDSTVDYGRSVSWGDTTVPLGTLANRMRELVARHGSYAAAMASPEAMTFLANG